MGNMESVVTKPRPAAPLAGGADYDISATALLLSLSISIWDACRTDRKVSEEVAKRHNTSAGRAGHYNKYLIDVKAPSYVAVKKAATELREFHYKHTLPWEDGWQIIRGGTPYVDYSKEFRKRVAAIERLVQKFLDDFPRLKANAKVELNGLYREADYPDDKELRSKFGIRLRKRPVPSDADFRVQMSKDEVAAIQADIRADMESSLNGAVRAAWERLRERVEHVATRLSEPPKKDPKTGELKGPIFRDSLVENLKEECSLLSSLNLLGDPRLDEMRYEAERLIKGITPEKLRTSETLRTKVAKDAAQLTAAMAAYMGA